ncbi:uncharacterized protein LOC105687663 [Athalia rosae]|uniref:uncharacterized protein LOC105687663 n=1 Tax=Athalia rosae TaxID=37344 RepID=UPI0020343C04|nr:uncharacterized protein LOC105687663 [Athalia rosae]
MDGDTRMFKRKLLLWVTSWLQEDQQDAKDQETIVTPDLVDIARLLQATGFKISHMDRSNPTEISQISEHSQDHPTCRVILMCPNSGVRIDLSAPTSTCTCSSSSSIFNHNWTAGEKSEEMMNFIAPKSSYESSENVTQVIRAVLQINSSLSDMNQNDTECHTCSPIEVVKTNSSMKTPATGIAVVTPNAPCIPKLTEEDANCSVIPGRYRSLDTLIAGKGCSDDLPDPGPLTPKEDENFNSDIAMDVEYCDLNATIIYTSDSEKKQQKTMNDVRPIRSLLDFASVKNSIRKVNPGVSLIPRPNFSRRSNPMMPITSGTPTTSRRSMTPSGGVRRKSASTTGLLTAGRVGKISTTDTNGRASRLVFPGTRSTSVKRGPSSSSTILNSAPKDKEARLITPRSKFTIRRLSIEKK